MTVIIPASTHAVDEEKSYGVHVHEHHEHIVSINKYLIIKRLCISLKTKQCT
jgi:hypothetical protein